MSIGRRGLDLAAMVGLVALAAFLRLPDLSTRGTWDADQGHDMLVLRSFVQDGIVPLLGPPTSIGDVHHGALYYYLLAPAAFLTGGDSPLAVVLEIALAGIAAVAVTWWLARSIGGPVAGLVAGLVLAVSTSAVDGSTFIWNPNLIALSSAIALAGAWRAWTTRRVAWWIVAALGTAVTVQCHVLGLAMAPVIGALLVADWRRREPGPGRRATTWAGVAWLLIVLGSYATPRDPRAAVRLLRGPGGPCLRPQRGRPDRGRSARALPDRLAAGPDLAADRTDHGGRRSRPARSGRGRFDRRTPLAGGRTRRTRGDPMAWPRPAMDLRLPDHRGPESRGRGPGPAERPLPRVRGPDGRDRHRAWGRRRLACDDPTAGRPRACPTRPLHLAGWRRYRGS